MNGEAASAFLQALQTAERQPIPADRLAVVVAHPDDETIGAAGLLMRTTGAHVLVVTDGAPRSAEVARDHGFASFQDYAAARREEFQGAMAIAGVPVERQIMLGFADQGATHGLAQLSAMLAGALIARNITTVVTHAYEGGHPDHDAVAFAVQAAWRLLQQRAHPLAAIEMPLYRLDAQGDCEFTTSFARPAEGATDYTVAGSMLERKRAMIAAHASQQEVLKLFDPVREQFRPAPLHDFTQLPNEGRLMYELYPWGMDGALFQRRVGEAMAALAREGLRWD
ncbi:MAG TPA: PIG-L family deacetylase [Aestuariivirgaceae bacterium]|nr:PIG-L family deacetylase [Aestuariivirgaceae bacterium]